MFFLSVEPRIMYAILESGGKQHKAIVGNFLKVEKLVADVGSTVELDKVLMISNEEDIRIGEPYLLSAKVSAEIVEQGKDDKIRIVKFRRRKHHLKQMGHRQQYTKVKVTGISGE
jgi:large subunit ribosomal protein L21